MPLLRTLLRRSCLLSGGHRQGDLQGDAEVFGHSDAAVGRGDAGRPGQDPCQTRWRVPALVVRVFCSIVKGRVGAACLGRVCFASGACQVQAQLGYRGEALQVRGHRLLRQQVPPWCLRDCEGGGEGLRRVEQRAPWTQVAFVSGF